MLGLARKQQEQHERNTNESLFIYLFIYYVWEGCSL